MNKYIFALFFLLYVVYSNQQTFILWSKQNEIIPLKNYTTGTYCLHSGSYFKSILYNNKTIERNSYSRNTIYNVTNESLNKTICIINENKIGGPIIVNFELCKDILNRTKIQVIIDNLSYYADSLTSMSDTESIIFIIIFSACCGFIFIFLCVLASGGCGCNICRNC